MEAVVSILGAEPWSAPGRGPRGRTAIVLVHGYTGNPRSIRPLAESLAADGFRVDVPLLPGHGTSHRDLAHTRYEDWVGVVERHLDQAREGADTVVLLGHSAGGTICLDLAGRRPDDVNGIVVINPLVRRPDHPLAPIAPLVALIVPFLPREALGMPTEDIARPDVAEHAYRVVPTRPTRSLIAELPRIRGQLIDLVAPLLVIRSPQDHTVTPGDALELLELVGTGDIRQLVCDRSYHLPQIDYDAEQVENAVRDFVIELAGS